MKGGGGGGEGEGGYSTVCARARTVACTRARTHTHISQGEAFCTAGVLCPQREAVCVALAMMCNGDGHKRRAYWTSRAGARQGIWQGERTMAKRANAERGTGGASLHRAGQPQTSHGRWCRPSGRWCSWGGINFTVLHVRLANLLDKRLGGISRPTGRSVMHGLRPLVAHAGRG